MQQPIAFFCKRHALRIAFCYPAYTGGNNFKNDMQLTSRAAFFGFVLASLLSTQPSSDAAESTQYGATYATLGPHYVQSAVATNPDGLAEKTVGVLATSNARVFIPGNGTVVSSNSSLVVGLNGPATGLEVWGDASIIVHPSPQSDQISVSKRGRGAAIGMASHDRGLVDFRGQVRVTNGTSSNTIIADFADASVLLFSGNGVGEQSGNGDAIGIRLTDSATAIATGSMSLVDNGNGNAIGAMVSDSAIALLTATINVEDRGNGDAIAIATSGDARVEFRGEAYLRESGNGVATFAALRERSHVVINGSMQSESIGNGYSPPLRLQDTASLDFVGGVLRYDSALPPGSVSHIELSDQSSLMWTGGTFDLRYRSVSLTPMVTLGDSSVLSILGHDFNVPAGVVKDLSGTLSGVLRDGSPFIFNFTRAEGATIHLIPEPTSGLTLLAGIGIGSSLRGNRD